ncbi:UMP kinase [Candidatus Woesearchaeota archaeon]|nr:UMP kinase [Candidatus Woesearchaeota archaeon]
MRTVVIKLGGSLVCPDKTDYDFLNEFKTLIEEYVDMKCRFGIVVGGGKLARRMQDEKRKEVGDDQNALDLVGIEATKINAKIVRDMFGDLADENLVIDYSKKAQTLKPVLIGAGYKPSWSTDYDTILLAEHLDTREVVVLSNISHVYDKDPNKYPDAKPYDKLSWEKMLKLCAGPWAPGKNTPLDPKAATQGAKNNHKVIFLKGLNNLKNYFDNKEFTGTVVEN